MIAEKQFHITEEDLLVLERSVPALCWSFMEHLTPKTRTQFRQLQTILSNVRWQYGPPTNVEKVE